MKELIQSVTLLQGVVLKTTDIPGYPVAIRCEGKASASANWVILRPPVDALYEAVTLLATAAVNVIPPLRDGTVEAMRRHFVSPSLQMRSREHAYISAPIEIIALFFGSPEGPRTCLIDDQTLILLKDWLPKAVDDAVLRSTLFEEVKAKGEARNEPV